MIGWLIGFASSYKIFKQYLIYYLEQKNVKTKHNFKLSILITFPIGNGLFVEFTLELS